MLGKIAAERHWFQHATNPIGFKMLETRRAYSNRFHVASCSKYNADCRFHFQNGADTVQLRDFS